MKQHVNKLRRSVLVGALALGAGVGAAGLASAATTSPTSTPAQSSPATNPADLTHGPGETLLTGTTLSQAVAAADAAEPGATVIRAETDSAGAAYEVHMTTSDGSVVTVKLDSAFHVTATESGFGAGPSGSAAPTGGAPSAPSSPTSY